MRKPDRLDVIQWVLLGLSVAVALYVWLQLSWYRQQAEQMGARLASYNASLIAVTDTMKANRDFVQQLSRSFSGCGNEKDANTLSLCYKFDAPYAAFLEAYSQAVEDRIRAASRADFESLATTYQRAIVMLDKYRDVPSSNAKYVAQWEARAREGLAYAELKTGNVSAASAEIQKATQLNAISELKSALVGTTALKILCIKKIDAGVVEMEFNRLHTLLQHQAIAANAKLGASELQMDTSLEARYLQDDSELYLMCKYAGIRPDFAK